MWTCCQNVYKLSVKDITDVKVHSNFLFFSKSFIIDWEVKCETQTGMTWGIALVGVVALVGWCCSSWLVLIPHSRQVVGCLFFLCLRGFTLKSPAFSHSPKNEVNSKLCIVCEWLFHLYLINCQRGPFIVALVSSDTDLRNKWGSELDGWMQNQNLILFNTLIWIVSRFSFLHVIDFLRLTIPQLAWKVC